jgi:hypothetical protein
VAWLVLFPMLGIAQFNLIEGPLARSVAVGHRRTCGRLRRMCVLQVVGGVSHCSITALVRTHGEVVVILLAAAVAWRIAAVCPAAAKLVLPVAVWTGYATAIVVGEMRRDALS